MFLWSFLFKSLQIYKNNCSCRPFREKKCCKSCTSAWKRTIGKPRNAQAIRKSNVTFIFCYSLNRIFLCKGRHFAWIIKKTSDFIMSYFGIYMIKPVPDINFQLREQGKFSESSQSLLCQFSVKSKYELYPFRHPFLPEILSCSGRDTTPRGLHIHVDAIAHTCTCNCIYMYVQTTRHAKLVDEARELQLIRPL